MCGREIVTVVLIYANDDCTYFSMNICIYIYYYLYLHKYTLSYYYISTLCMLKMVCLYMLFSIRNYKCILLVRCKSIPNSLPGA